MLARSGEELLRICEEENISLSEYAIRIEMEDKGLSREEVYENMAKNLKVMKDGVKVVKAFDYKLSEEITYGNETIVSEIKLPKSNVLKYILEDDSWFVVRPSGTEPKMKIYLSVVGKSLKDSEEKLNSFKNSVMNRINNILA